MRGTNLRAFTRNILHLTPRPCLCLFQDVVYRLLYRNGNVVMRPLYEGQRRTSVFSEQPRVVGLLHPPPRATIRPSTTLTSAGSSRASVEQEAKLCMRLRPPARRPRASQFLSSSHRVPPCHTLVYVRRLNPSDTLLCSREATACASLPFRPRRRIG